MEETCLEILLHFQMDIWILDEKTEGIPANYTLSTTSEKGWRGLNLFQLHSFQFMLLA